MQITFHGQLLGSWRTNHKPDNLKHKDKPMRLVFVPNRALAGTLLYIKSFSIDYPSADPRAVIDDIIKERFPDGKSPLPASTPGVSGPEGSSKPAQNLKKP